MTNEFRISVHKTQWKKIYQTTFTFFIDGTCISIDDWKAKEIIHQFKLKKRKSFYVAGSKIFHDKGHWVTPYD